MHAINKNNSYQKLHIKLHEKLQHLVEELASLAQVDKGHAFNEIMAATSLFAGGMFKVYNPLIRQFINCNNFYMTIAGSSERKSTVQNILLQEYNKLFYEKELERIYTDEWHSYHLELSSWEKDVKKNIDNVESYINEKPLEPVDPRIFIDDITQEGLFYKLSQGRLPFAAVWSAEGGVFFKCIGMTGDNVGKIYFMLNKLWSNESITSTRKQFRGVQSINESAVTLNLAMQENVFYENVATEDNEDIGFLARVLVHKPDSLAGTRTLDKIKNHYDKYNDTAKSVLGKYTLKIANNLITIFNKFIEDRKLSFTDINLSSEAVELLGRKYDIIEEKQAEGGEYQYHKAFAGKMVQHILRVAVNIMYIRGGWDYLDYIIEKEDIECAYDIICWYMANHMELTKSNNASSYKLEKKISNIISYIKKAEASRGLFNISYKEIRDRTSLNNCKTNIDREFLIKELVNREVVIDMRDSNKRVVIDGKKINKYFEIVKEVNIPTCKADPNDDYVENIVR